MRTNNYTPEPYAPGLQGNDKKGCKGIVMNAIMLTLGTLAAVAVLVTNVVNRRRHSVVTARTHDYAVAVMIAVAIIVLLYMPVGAQDIGGATQSNTLYLPQIAWRFPSWFTDDELTQAMIRDGYDPDVASMHTICTLDASATPPDDVRYSSCEQFWVNGEATEGTQHYIWWLRLNDGKVHGVEVGGTMVQSAGTDAPCYVDDDQEVSCG